MRYTIQLVGCSFDNRQTYLADIQRRPRPATDFSLLREVQNIHDKNAVAVMVSKPLPAKIGYIPAYFAKNIADKLDQGETIPIQAVTILGGTTHKPNLGCQIQIDLDI